MPSTHSGKFHCMLKWTPRCVMPIERELTELGHLIPCVRACARVFLWCHGPVCLPSHSLLCVLTCLSTHTSKAWCTRAVHRWARHPAACR